MKALREVLAAAAILFAIFITASNYAALPQNIPSHFNINGAVNGWGDKSFLWLLIALACVIYFALTLARFVPPSSFNVPVGPEQRAAAIPIALDMIAWIKAETVWMFAAIIWSIIATAQSHRDGLSIWFLPVILLVVFGTCGFYLARIMRLSSSPPIID